MLKQFLFGSSIKEPIFLKDFKDDNTQLKDLENLINQVKTSKVNQIKTDYYLLKYGIEGEKNIRYELKNSFLPMLILHDIRLDDGEHSAQMDYVILTSYFIMIIETKRLVGDIYINEAGDFIRNLKSKNGKCFKKDGIFSPISQNERHVRILRKILNNNKLIKDEPILSCVTIANPKSIILKSNAPQDVQKQIIKYDQLTKYISNTIDSYKSAKSNKISDKTLYSISNFLIENNKKVSVDLSSKYQLNDKYFNINPKPPIVKKTIKKSKETLKAEIKEFRLTKARLEEIPPYCVFKNTTLDEIIETMPKTKDELLKIQGLGPVKVEKYGQAILDILK